MKFLPTKLLKSNFYVFLLLSISLFLCYKNYTDGTFLTGWDTLHPEFNLKIYWKRILDGAWQEHQGLGAVNTQAHASEIPRMLIISIMSIFLDVSLIRYLYAFLMLILGPLGVYFFIDSILLSSLPRKASKFGAFASGLFYLLNLGTVQHFYVPLEMFLTHYGLLGWSFLFLSKSFLHFTRKNVFMFLVISFFMAPQAHTATLFYAYFLGICLYLFILTLSTFTSERKFHHNVGISVSLISLTLLINFFWLLPNIYFILNKGSSIQESKIHHLFSEEAFLANKRFGTVENIALVKGFLFDWGEYVGRAEYGQLLNEWRGYYSSSGYEFLGYVFFGCVLLGVLLSILKRNIIGFGLIGLLFMSIVFLMNSNPPFGFIFSAIQERFPIFREALRFPFTKFSILLMLSYASFFGLFWGYFSSVFHSFTKNRFVHNNLYLLLLVFLLISFYNYMRPAFYGGLISPSMRVNIPNRYFEMFDYINSQKDYGRIADFPIHSLWGWVYYNWNPITEMGYQGAGFLWFGIDKPLINREFDRWNLSNEQVFRELSYAVYSRNILLLENTLEKFQIRWLLLDDSVLAPGYPSSVLFNKEIKELFTSSSRIELAKDFGEGLYIYTYTPKVAFELENPSFPYVTIGDPFFRDPVDPFYNNFGNYIHSFDRDFPLVGTMGLDEEIITPVLTSDSKYTFLEFSRRSSPLEGSFIPVGSAYPILSSSKELVVLGNTHLIYSLMDFKNLYVDPIIDTYAQIFSLGRDFPVVNIYPVLEACSFAQPNASYSLERIEGGFSLSSKNINACVTASLSDVGSLPQKESDLFVMQGSSINNNNVCISEVGSGLCLNVSVNGNIVAYLDKPISNYKISLFSGFSNVLTDNTTLFKDIRMGWGLAREVIYFNTSSASEASNYYVLPKYTAYSPIASHMQNNPRFCDLSSFDLNQTSVRKDLSSIYYSSSTKSICDSFFFHTLPHSMGYIMEIVSRNIEGVPLRICLTNESTKKCEVYFSLPRNKDFSTYYYFIPPSGEGIGYTLDIANLVFGRSLSSNAISYVSFTPVSYPWLKSFTSINNFSQEKNTLFFYGQSYDPGWIALCGGELCDAKHVVVNNWANGWLFNGVVPENVKIVFWPQYLEYLGFGLLLTAFIWTLSLPKHKQETK